MKLVKEYIELLKDINSVTESESKKMLNNK